MIKLDYANFVFSSDSPALRDYLVSFLLDRYGAGSSVFLGGGFHGYDNSERLSYDNRTLGVLAYGGASQRGTLLLSLSGRGLDVLGWYGVSSFLRRVIRDFRGVRVKCTRIDIAIDVPGDTWRVFFADFSKRIIESRLTNVDIIYNYRRDPVPAHPEDMMSGRGKFYPRTGTAYVGSRSSPRMLRVYAKDIENYGRVSRYEMECHEGYSSSVLAFLLAGGSLADAARCVFSHFVRLDDIIPDIGAHWEYPCVPPFKSRFTDTGKWILTISGALSQYADAEPIKFELALLAGADKVGVAPYGNTGVHLPQLPRQVAALHELSFSYDTQTPICFENYLNF